MGGRDSVAASGPELAAAEGSSGLCRPICWMCFDEVLHRVCGPEFGGGLNFSVHAKAQEFLACSPPGQRPEITQGVVLEARP